MILRNNRFMYSYLVAVLCVTNTHLCFTEAFVGPVQKRGSRQRSGRNTVPSPNQASPPFLLLAVNDEKERITTTTTTTSSTTTAPKKLGKKEGVYARPSAAIERGSGFFIPGLEGPRIRVAVGIILLVATIVNHVLTPSSSGSIIDTGTAGAGAGSLLLSIDNGTNAGNTLAEVLAVLYGILVLIQAGVEAVQELQSRIQVGSVQSSATAIKTATTTSTATASEAWSPSSPNDAKWRERVEWSARTILALTAVTQVLLVGPEGVVYRLSKFSSSTNDDDDHNHSITANKNKYKVDDENDDDDDDDNRAIQALTETLQQSPSGRVSLPPTHPAAQVWAPNQNCIVVQRISSSTTEDKDSSSNNSNSSNNDSSPRNESSMTTTTTTTTWAWIVTSPESLAATLTQRDLRWLGPLSENVVLPTTQ